MQSLAQVFSMYNRPQFETPQTDVYLDQWNQDKRNADRARQSGLRLGEIATTKYQIDNAPEGMDTSELQSTMYEQMGEAGYGKEAINQMFPKPQNNSFLQKQQANQKMMEIDAELGVLGRQYISAVKNNETAQAEALYSKAQGLLKEYGQYAFGTNQRPKNLRMFEMKAPDLGNIETMNAQEAIIDAQQKLDQGLITEDQYNDIYYANLAKGIGAGGDVVNVQGEISEEQRAQADESRKARQYQLGLSDAEDQIYDDGLANLGKFKVLASVDAYNRYLPTLKSEYEAAKAGKAGAQRAIVVAFNKLIEPSSAVMEGDFRSSGNNALVSAGQQLGDASQAVMSGNFDALGRRLSADEIEAIYQSGLRIGEALRGSVQSRVNQEEAKIQERMQKRGFNYKPNSFVSYIGFNSKAPKQASSLNPANFSSRNAFLDAGGTRQQWKAYLKSKGN